MSKHPDEIISLSLIIGKFNFVPHVTNIFELLRISKYFFPKFYFCLFSFENHIQDVL